MNEINQPYIEAYLEGLLGDKSYYPDIEAYARDHHVPIVGRQVAELLRVLIKIHQPGTIVELGTAIGYSALVMADSLLGDFKMITIERNEERAALAKANIAKNGYESKIDVLVGDGLDIIKFCRFPIDFCFIDAAKGQYREFFDPLFEQLVPGGIIVSDNVLYKGMIASDELFQKRKVTIIHRLREYLHYITHTKGMTTALIPIGDGVAITYKEKP